MPCNITMYKLVLKGFVMPKWCHMYTRFDHDIGHDQYKFLVF